MVRSRRPKAWLALSIANSLAVLGFFKYGAFIANNVNATLSLAGLASVVPVPKSLLPAGLSFFLLQSSGYVIDVHRGTVEREKSFLTHAAFVSFFPRLLAGPIERAGHLLPQLRTSVPVTLRDFTDGLSIFVVGLLQEGRPGRLPGPVRRQGLPDARRVPGPGPDPGDLPLRLADLLRLQRLHGHGPGHRPHDGHSPDAELRQPLPGERHGRLLEALAHQPLVLVPRLRLHPAGRQPQRQGSHLPERLPDDGPLRPLARGGVDLS